MPSTPYSGRTDELNQVVEQAATMLRDAYGMDVTIRFNSDRKSGGAWLVTDETDGFGANAEIGLCALQPYADQAEKDERVDELWRRYGAESDWLALARDTPVGEIYVYAYIGTRALADKTLANGRADDPKRCYYHDGHDSLQDALVFLQEHGDLSFLQP